MQFAPINSLLLNTKLSFIMCLTASNNDRNSKKDIQVKPKPRQKTPIFVTTDPDRLGQH